MRVHMPIGGAQLRGREVKTVSLSFPERLLMQRVNVYAIAAVLLLTTLTGMMSMTYEVMVVMITFGVLCFPVRCIITTEGVAINKVVFRPWGELTSFSTERRRIRLEGREGTRPLMLPLLSGRQQEVLPALRRYLKPAEAAPEAKVSRSPVRQAR